MADFLGFKVRGDSSVTLRFSDTSSSTESIAIRQRKVRSRARAFEWIFSLQPDAEWNPLNMGGVLQAHYEDVEYGEFDWPGVALQKPGHKEIVAAKTITTLASIGSREIVVNNSTDILSSRLIQLPGSSRVYMVSNISVGVDSSTLRVQPRLRNDVAANTQLVATIVPRVKYHNDMESEMVYRGNALDNRIHLIEA